MSIIDTQTLLLDMQEALDVLCEEQATDVARAYWFLKSLAAVGRDVPETLYKIYASGVGIPRETLYAVTSFMEGAGFINIICDCWDGGGLCEKPSHFHNGSYDNGLSRLQAEADDYAEIEKQIGNIRGCYI